MKTYSFNLNPELMKPILRIPILLLTLISLTLNAWAQPANDNCAEAFQVAFSESEETVVLTNGDSRGATASTSPILGECSLTFFTDDTWYTFTTPALMPDGYVIIRAYFRNGPSTDVPAIGMGLYESCGASETPIECFSSTVPEDDRFQIPAWCLLPDHTYSLRIWSTGADASTEGTFRVGVYSLPFPADTILWEDQFESNPFSRGWTTFGECAIKPDSSINAVWDYLPDGSIQPGAFTPATTIISESYCNGAMGVNSDFNDNKGNGATVGQGSVPTALNANGSQSDPATYVIQTPPIFMGDWNASGISVQFNQGVRNLNSSFSLSYRNKNTGDPAWGDWVDFEINSDLIPNDPPLFNTIRQFLPGAHEADSIQLKLTYLAHYYFWMIDDFKIISTECTNTRVQTNFFAIAPFVRIPSDQVYPFGALADIYNAGACSQDNVTLNLTVQNIATNEIVYNANFDYGTISPDSLAENQLFPELIDLPHVAADYKATYRLTQDSIDYNPIDNEISYLFSVGGDTFALENGFTTSIAVSQSVYNVNAPLSYAYGNYYRAVSETEVDYVQWGAGNATDMAGKTVSVYLEQWTDTNGDQIAQSSERIFVANTEYTFTGAEGDNAIIKSELVNFNNAGSPIIMEAGLGYMVIVEYVASTSQDPQFFTLASDQHDYSAQQLAMDTAVAKGLASLPVYFSVLGFSPDGNIANIDYEVKEINVNDNRIFFGNNVVPVVRIVQKFKVNTKDELPVNSLITIYPNPVSEVIQVKMEFTKPYNDVKLRLINNIGQTVLTKTLSSITSSHIEPINVSTIAVGNYRLQVETPDGQRSLPVIVIRE